MSDKNIEIMKKIIESKKQKSAVQGCNSRPEKNIGGARKAISNKKNGGLFDK